MLGEALSMLRDAVEMKLIVAVLFVLISISTSAWGQSSNLSAADIAAINNASQATGVPTTVLFGIQSIETGGENNPDIATNAVSGAQGLFQVLPSTAAQPGFGVAPLTNPLDPNASALFAAQYISALQNQPGGSLASAIQQYSGGGYTLSQVTTAGAGLGGAIGGESLAGVNVTPTNFGTGTTVAAPAGAGGGMNWQVFQSIYNQVEQPLLQQVDGISDALLNAIATPLRWAMVIYIAFVGLMICAGRMTEPVRDTWWRLAKGAAIAAFLTAGTYNTYVRDFFLNGLPNDLTSAITGGTGTVNAASFDAVWNKAFGGGLAVWKTLYWTDIGLEFVIVIYWCAALVATSFGFLVWIASHIVLGLYVAVGPVLLATLLFPATRSLGQRWIGAMLSMALLQVFIIALLVILTGAETSLLANINAAGGKAVEGIQIILGCVILFVVAAAIVSQLPGAAAAIAGGLYFQTATLYAATMGASAQLGMSAIGGARQIAGRAGASAQRRLTAGHIPGPSLSSSAMSGARL